MKKIIYGILLAILGVSSIASTALAAGQLIEDLDVSGVKATALDKAVKIEWEAVNYSGKGPIKYTVWYDSASVENDGESYSNKQENISGLSATISGLTNGTKYYFSVTAFDADGNESKNWSFPEVNATPSAEGPAFEDSDGPQVAETEALNKEEVKIVFTEEVVLLDEEPESAFVIENMDSLQELTVKGAKMDPEDDSGKTIILETAAQEKDAKYQLTVGIDVTDKSGNPIVSGTSSMGIFTGSDKEKPKDGPALLNVEVVDSTHILVNFNKAIVLSVDPEKNFSIVSKDDETVKLEITEIELGANKDAVTDAAALITTSDQEPALSYVVTASGLFDLDGLELETGKDTASFKGFGEEAPVEEEDPGAIGPKDVANFLAKKFFEAEKYTVNLSWKIPSENIGKVIEQVLYMSDDKGKKYDEEAKMEPDVNKYEVKNLDAGEYWFKITQKDEQGNETKGKIVKILLSETGPGMIGLVLVSLGLGRVLGKRKK